MAEEGRKLLNLVKIKSLVVSLTIKTTAVQRMEAKVARGIKLKYGVNKLSARMIIVPV